MLKYKDFVIRLIKIIFYNYLNKINLVLKYIQTLYYKRSLPLSNVTQHGWWSLIILSFMLINSNLV